MNRLQKLAGLFVHDPFPDIKNILTDAAREGGWGDITFKNNDNHVYLNNERKATFIGTDGDRQYIATNSSSFPIKGNKVTATAILLRCPNREAFSWLCKKYNVSNDDAEDYKKNDPSWDGKFISGGELVERAKAKHNSMSPDKVMTYGIKELDDQLGGIYPSDLVIFGARSGTGKSTFVDNVIISNAKKGKTILFFQLEMDDDDPVQRRVFYNMNRKLGRDNKPFVDKIRFRNNDITKEQRDLRDEMYKKDAETMKNVISYIGEPLDHQMCLDALETMRGRDIDLVVIDHLHYFDKTEGDKGDTLSALMKEIRYMNKKYSLPFILVSQLRKAAIYGQEPTLEDLKGSGDLNTIPTTGILMHRDKEDTKFIIDKSRAMGMSQHKITANFDKNTGLYKPADGKTSKPKSFSQF
jgi:KaiC/GvpD/RAD55 family RecA-like ATPase